MIRFFRAAWFGLICSLSLLAPASAADYPNRPVRWLIGFTAGGPVDTVARIMSQWLSDRLGQQFVVENRAAPAAIWRRPRRSIRRPTATRCCSSRLTTRSAPRSTRNCHSISSATPRRSPASCSYQHAGGLQCHAGEDGSGTDRLLQGPPQSDLLRLFGQRHLGSHVGGIVQGDDQMRDAARALPGLL